MILIAKTDQNTKGLQLQQECLIEKEKGGSEKREKGKNKTVPLQYLMTVQSYRAYL